MWQANARGGDPSYTSGGWPRVQTPHTPAVFAPAVSPPRQIFRSGVNRSRTLQTLACFVPQKHGWPVRVGRRGSHELGHPLPSGNPHIKHAGHLTHKHDAQRSWIVQVFGVSGVGVASVGTCHPVRTAPNRIIRTTATPTKNGTHSLKLWVSRNATEPATAARA